MTPPRTPFAGIVGAFALLGCSGTPPRPAPAPPTPVVSAPEPAPPPRPAPEQRGRAHFAKLDNGLSVSITEARPGTEAQLQLTFRTGRVASAPGLAELALEALVGSADASQGRPTLERAIADLGGIVRTEVGLDTAWLGIRVPAAKWQDAQAALLTALVAPAQPRGQLERLRERLVQARCATIQARPTTAMARALLLGRADTAAYVTGLVDRDPSEVGLFQSRAFRPELSVCALHVPGDPAANAAALSRPGAAGLARWSPPTIAAPTATPQPIAVLGGTHWSPGLPKETCRAALVLFDASADDPDAASLQLLQACVTLDGTGGRFERLLADAGLGQLRWTSERVAITDRTALVLSTDAPAALAAQIWQVFERTRASLRDVPLTASEYELASRRARLTTNLGQLDDLARLREQTNRRAQSAGVEPTAGAFARPGTPDFDRALAAFLALPAAAIVVGGEIPADATVVHRFELLPPGMRGTPVATASPNEPSPTPWIDRAADALGGASLLKRLAGCAAEGRLQSESAPPITETLTWRTDGTVRRTRDVLGNRIETRLEGNAWTEQFGTEKQVLQASDAALLRRELDRHPLALLAAHVKGALRFRTIAQRTVGDRDLMILQAEGDRFDRLRIHVDTGSHLIRVVEVWESMSDGTTVHLQDAWSDYRSIDGLRVPFRRVTTQDEGQNRVEMVFTKWLPEFAAL